MEYTYTVMTQEEAEEIAYNWHYEGKYSFYDIEADEEDLAEFYKIRVEESYIFCEGKWHSLVILLFVK